MKCKKCKEICNDGFSKLCCSCWNKQYENVESYIDDFSIELCNLCKEKLQIKFNEAISTPNNNPQFIQNISERIEKALSFSLKYKSKNSNLVFEYKIYELINK